MMLLGNLYFGILAGLPQSGFEEEARLRSVCDPMEVLVTRTKEYSATEYSLCPKK